MKTSDANLKNSFKISKEKGIEYKFIVKNLGEKYHPNTVKIVLKDNKRKMSVMGSSIGGGMIEIVKIDNFDILIKGQAGLYLSLVVEHDKKFNLVSGLVPKLKKLDVKVAGVESTIYKSKMLSVLSTEGHRINLREVMKLEKSVKDKGVDFIRALSKLEK